MSMKAIVTLLVALSACGTAADVAPEPGSCTAPSKTVASVEMTGFPTGPFTGSALEANGGWLTATTSSCALRWLRIQAGIFDISVVYSGAILPSSVPATAVPTPGDCVPANAPAVVTAGGGAWVATGGTIQLATATQQAGLRSTVTVTSSDLVLKNPITNEVRNVTFSIMTDVGHFCAAHVAGDPAGVATWQIRTPTVQNGSPSCSNGPVGDEWTGQPTALSPPWNCSAKSGAAPQAGTPVNAKDAN